MEVLSVIYFETVGSGVLLLNCVEVNLQGYCLPSFVERQCECCLSVRYQERIIGVRAAGERRDAGRSAVRVGVAESVV